MNIDCTKSGTPVKPSEFPDGTWFVTLGATMTFAARKHGDKMVYMDGSTCHVKIADKDGNWCEVDTVIFIAK